MPDSPGRRVVFDGSSISLDPGASGRTFFADGRCFEGSPEPRAWASVCASTDSGAALPFDAPEVQQARRDALAWWLPLLGGDLVCVTTLALDGVRYGGAITVVRSDRDLSADPFARLFASTLIDVSGTFAVVDPPLGPVIERYAGHPWPGGGFPSSHPS